MGYPCVVISLVQKAPPSLRPPQALPFLPSSKAIIPRPLVDFKDYLNDIFPNEILALFGLVFAFSPPESQIIYSLASTKHIAHTHIQVQL